MKLPVARSEILYCRITVKNKAFVQEMAAERGVSESVYLDYVLTKLRNKEAVA